MEKSFSESYKEAGVDITAGYESVRLMKNDVERTKTAGCLDSIGGFGGMFMPDISGMDIAQKLYIYNKKKKTIV